MRVKKDWRNMIEGVMTEYRVTHWEWTECNHHPAIQFFSPSDRTTRKISFPGSTSDHRSLMNSRAEIRRALKVAGYTKQEKAA